MLENRILNEKTAPGSPEDLHITGQMDELAREFINNLGRLADFFGFNRLMGQLYAVLFLSPEPLTLDEMVKRLDSSKGNISINIRALERWGLVHQIYKWADRKNYYEAETDVWKAVSGILQERERKENQQVLHSLSQNMEKLEKVSAVASTSEAELASFYLKRMEVFRRLLQFGDQLLGIMVAGGEVDFGHARHMTASEGQTGEEGNPDLALIIEEVDNED